LKTYEREALLKTFAIFFVLLETLLLINYWYEYERVKVETRNYVLTEMRLCAYTLQCDGMETDFADKKSKRSESNRLFENEAFYAYFDIPSKKFLMKVIYPKERFEKKLKERVGILKSKLAVFSVIAAVVSLMISFYTLLPLRRALHLNEEFVKDVLHDFNTPLSSMRLNLWLFKKTIGEDPKIVRLEHNIETILSLQENLRLFLKELPTNSEEFDIVSILEDRIRYFTVLYPDIRFKTSLKPLKVRTLKNAFVRIADNIIDNAAKYNKRGGTVKVFMEKNVLHIQDTGKGIVDTRRVFERYYKEQERGIGIGMHVVKKLCDETNIKIDVKSTPGKGTRISLDLSDIVV
jgi:signal transduction histidine kinase